MKFKTTELISRIDDLIAERLADAEQTHATTLKQAAAARETWLEEKGPGYVEFANRVKEKIRKGRPILHSDIPQEIRGRYDGIEVFRGAENPKKSEAFTRDLTTLKAALTAVSDEHVTTTSLREIGFKDIAALFRTEK